MEPSINAAITNGSAIITGNYTYQSAYEYATKLQSGTFGVTLQLAEVRSISATLGENSIRTALIAGIIGVALIFIFMACVYRGLGLAATSRFACTSCCSFGSAQCSRGCNSHSPVLRVSCFQSVWQSTQTSSYSRESRTNTNIPQSPFQLASRQVSNAPRAHYRRSGYDAHRLQLCFGCSALRQSSALP